MSAEEQALFGISKLNAQRSEVSAVTYVNYSARIQTVHNETNLIYYALISRHKELIDCRVIVNINFIVRGEPFVCSALDAFQCSMGTKGELLVISNAILQKDEQDSALKRNY